MFLCSIPKARCDVDCVDLFRCEWWLCVEHVKSFVPHWRCLPRKPTQQDSCKHTLHLPWMKGPAFLGIQKYTARSRLVSIKTLAWNTHKEPTAHPKKLSLSAVGFVWKYSHPSSAPKAVWFWCLETGNPHLDLLVRCVGKVSKISQERNFCFWHQVSFDTVGTKLTKQSTILCIT